MRTKSQMLAFSKWCCLMGWYWMDGEGWIRWIHKGKSKETLTDNQLYEKFREQTQATDKRRTVENRKKETAG